MATGFHVSLTKLRISLLVLLIVLAAILLLRVRDNGNRISIRDVYFNIQSIGSDFCIMYPWKIAYPSCLSKQQFNAMFVISTLIRSFSFCFGNIFLESETTPYKCSKAVSEVVMFACNFIVLPLCYRKKNQRQSLMLFFSMFAALYICVTGITNYWKWHVMSDYGFLLLLVWACFVINDINHFQEKTKDFGYLICYGALTFSVPSYIGMIMFEHFSSASPELQVVIISVWTIICCILRTLWSYVAKWALCTDTAHLLMFPLQLCFDIYDELIFCLMSWNSAEFSFYFFFRICVNFLYNGGIFASIPAKMKYLKLSKSKTTEDENAMLSIVELKYRNLLKQFKLLEQNTLTECLASLAILFAFLVEFSLNSVNFGKTSISTGMSVAEKWDMIYTYCIVTCGMFLSCFAAEQMLRHRWKKINMELVKIISTKEENSYRKGLAARFLLALRRDKSIRKIHVIEEEDSRQENAESCHASLSSCTTGKKNSNVSASSNQESIEHASLTTKMESRIETQGITGMEVGRTKCAAETKEKCPERTSWSPTPHEGTAGISISPVSSIYASRAPSPSVDEIWRGHVGFYVSVFLFVIFESLYRYMRSKGYYSSA
mmetsp:Transcript_32988/g.42149  ORF Transcript_32988/g.42149 Transcript_32988/m.42149 type:complete len:604 (-) Transcript_32988:369-2180(-)